MKLEMVSLEMVRGNSVKTNDFLYPKVRAPAAEHLLLSTPPWVYFTHTHHTLQQCMTPLCQINDVMS